MNEEVDNSLLILIKVCGVLLVMLITIIVFFEVNYDYDSLCKQCNHITATDHKFHLVNLFIYIRYVECDNEHLIRLKQNYYENDIWGNENLVFKDKLECNYEQGDVR